MTGDLLADVVAAYGTPSSSVEIGSGYRVHFYAEGPPRFEHRCDRGRRGTIICAPSLENHTIVTRDPLTITASILCSDCGTHGFVRDGHWETA